MKIHSFSLVIYTLVAVWGATLGILFVLDVIDPRSFPWDTEYLAVLETQGVRNLLSVISGFLGGLLFGVSCLLAVTIWSSLIASAGVRNLVAFILSASFIVPQLFTWIRLGVSSPRIVFLAVFALMVLLAFILGRRQEND